MISAYLDRFEDDLAVLLLGDEMKKVNFPKCFLPEGVGEGDYLKIDIAYDKGSDGESRAGSARPSQRRLMHESRHT